MTDIRDRVKEFMGKHNEEFPAKKVRQSFEHLRVHYCMCWYTVAAAIAVLLTMTPPGTG